MSPIACSKCFSMYPKFVEACKQRKLRISPAESRSALPRLRRIFWFRRGKRNLPREDDSYKLLIGWTLYFSRCQAYICTSQRARYKPVSGGSESPDIMLSSSSYKIPSVTHLLFVVTDIVLHNSLFLPTINTPICVHLTS